MKTQKTLLTKLTIPLNSQTPPFIVAIANHIPLFSNKLIKKHEYIDAKENEPSTYLPFLTGTTSTKGIVLLSTVLYKPGSWILALDSMCLAVTTVKLVFI